MKAKQYEPGKCEHCWFQQAVLPAMSQPRTSLPVILQNLRTTEPTKTI